MILSIAIVIIWVLAGLAVLSGYTRPAGCLMLGIVGLHVAYGGYLISNG